MTEERIQLPEDEDFIIWDPFEYSWQLRFEELCQWIKINGHDAMRRKVGR
jgi:hypothetical protein